MSLVRILHVTLPDDLATHISPTTDADAALPNRCLIVDPVRQRATLTRWAHAAASDDEARSHIGAVSTTPTQSSVLHNASTTGTRVGARTATDRELAYDTLVIHPHNLSLFDTRIRPILDEVCARLVNTADADGAGERPDDGIRSLLLYGSRRTENGDGSGGHGRSVAGASCGGDLFSSLSADSPAIPCLSADADTPANPQVELFIELIWRASQHLLAHHAPPSSGESDASQRPSPHPLTTWFSLANLYPRWGVGDVLDARDLMHKADHHGQSPSSGRHTPSTRTSPFHLTMKPLEDVAGTPQTLLSVLRTADRPDNLRAAPASTQQDHKHRSVLVCTLTVVATATGRAGCVHLVLLPDATAVKELTGVSAGLSLLTVAPSPHGEREAARAAARGALVRRREASVPLAGAAQRSLKGSCVWRFLVDFAHGRIECTRHPRRLVRCTDRALSLVSSSSSAVVASSSLSLRTIQCSVGSAPLLVVCVRSAWSCYAETRSAFAFARRASSRPPSWWWRGRSQPRRHGAIFSSSSSSCSHLSTASVPAAMDKAVAAAEEDERVQQGAIVKVAQARLDATDCSGDVYRSEAAARTSHPEASSTLSSSASACSTTEVAAAGVHDDVINAQRLLQQKDALIASLQSELALLREENSRLRRHRMTHTPTETAPAGVSSAVQGSPSTRTRATACGDDQKQHIVDLACDLFLQPDATRAQRLHTRDDWDCEADEELRVPDARARCTHLCWRCDASLTARSNRLYYESFIPLLRQQQREQREQRDDEEGYACAARGPPSSTQHASVSVCEARHNASLLSHTPSCARDDDVRQLQARLRDYEAIFATWRSLVEPQITADLAALETRERHHQDRDARIQAEHALTVRDISRLVSRLDLDQSAKH